MLIEDDSDVEELKRVCSDTTKAVHIYVEVGTIAEEQAMVSPCRARKGKRGVASGVVP